jgi:hypothetical protein
METYPKFPMTTADICGTRTPVSAGILQTIR